MRGRSIGIVAATVTCALTLAGAASAWNDEPSQEPIPGPPGLNGARGADGAPGTPGLNGADGAPGTPADICPNIDGIQSTFRIPGFVATLNSRGQLVCVRLRTAARWHPRSG